MAEGSVSIPRQHHLRQKAVNEFKSYIVIVLYLWVVFGVMSIHKSIVLGQHHLNYPEHAFAIINALIFAKVLLIGEYFHLGERFGDKALVYPIVFKCFVFTVFLICFHIAESILVGVWHGNTVANSFPEIGDGSPKAILSLGIMSFVLLLPFFGFREFGRVIGHKELRALLFKHRKSDPKLTW